MSSLEFPDLLYPEYRQYHDQSHEILLDQWSTTTMDLSLEKKFVMQKITPSNCTTSLRAAAPPFTYSIAREKLDHMNKYTLSTKSINNSNRLISKHGHLIYVTKKNQLNIHSIPKNTYDELWINPIPHLSASMNERRHIVRSTDPIQLLDCRDETNDSSCSLSIAVTDEKGLAFFQYDSSSSTCISVSQTEIPHQIPIHTFAFNPYITRNGILVDEKFDVHLMDDDQVTFLHRLNNETLTQTDIDRQITIQWDASPFLYTISDNYRNHCLLFDLRVRNEAFKELFSIHTNHSYLSPNEVVHCYQSSVINPYQHVFVTDYSIIVIDSRMPNRAVLS